MRWLRKKFKRLASAKKAKACWKRVTAQYPRLFAHWAWVPYSCGQDDRSRMTGDCQVRICGGPEEVPPGYPT
jgi:hypothetical protein